MFYLFHFLSFFYIISLLALSYWYFCLRHKSPGVFRFFLHIFFLLSIGLAAGSVFAPQIYRVPASIAVDYLGIRSQLREIDSKVIPIEWGPLDYEIEVQKILEKIWSPWLDEPNSSADQTPQIGVLERMITPIFVKYIAQLFSWTGFLLSLPLAALVFCIRLLHSALDRNRKLEQKIEALEEEVEIELELNEELVEDAEGLITDAETDH